MSTPKVDIGVGVMPITIDDDKKITLLDQRTLPNSVTYYDATEFDSMLYAIKNMVVRGAPSIGVAGAFGLASKAISLSKEESNLDNFLEKLNSARVEIQQTRPTAVNLMWETDNIFNKAKELVEAQKEGTDTESVADALIEQAKELLDGHLRNNRKLSEYGCDYMTKAPKILTHCNAGSLAACGWGTALGVIRSAKLRGYSPSVYVDETRPRSQGAKITMWELKEDDIESKLVCDSMAGYLMANKLVDLVIVGADRIARNGDTANKIGTYNLAVLAKYHNIPFYVAAPIATIDRNLEDGKGIPIEERDIEEVTIVNGSSITIKGADAFNPAFDVTPNSLITAIFTEAGVLIPDFTDSISKVLA